MKNALLSIVTATLLACGSAAAAGSGDACAPGAFRLSAGQGVGLGVRMARVACGASAKAAFLRGNQNFLSDKELEQALRTQLRGRLIDAKLNAAQGVYYVLWEMPPEGGRRKLRKLIVDAKTGKVKREILG